MNRIFQSAVCGCILTLWATGLYAQGLTQRVIYPDGRVVYEPIGTVQAAPVAVPASVNVTQERALPWSGAPVPAIVCDPCKSPSQPPYCPGCMPGCNWPRIETNPPYCPPAHTETIPISIDKVGEIDEEPEDYEDFYKTCHSFESKIEVPYIRTAKKSTIQFKTVTYTYKCCKYTVCVPCACVKTCSTECAKKTIPARLVKKVRRDGKIDVYAVGVKGFPKEWVVCFELADEAAFNHAYPGVTLTACATE